MEGVMQRASHHAGNVNEIALAIIGAIIWCKAADPIKVSTRKGNMKNILWVKMKSGREYAFTYDHKSGSIQIRDRNRSGATLYSLTNAIPLSNLLAIFLTL